MSFASVVAVALSAVLTQGGASTSSIQFPMMPQAQSVEEYVENYFADTPIMIKVAECESHFHQYDSDGSIYRGVVNNQDVGVMQVNEHYHLATSKKLGLDLYTMQGNVAYAKYLYTKQGTAPWSSSKPCWGKTEKLLASAK